MERKEMAMKKIISFLVGAFVVCLLCVAPKIAVAADEYVKLTITPDKTIIDTTNSDQIVNYTIAVEIPDNINIGSIQFKLEPSEGMVLGEYTYPEANKLINSSDNSQGVFQVLEYNPASQIFIAANTDRGLSTNSVLLNIQTTILQGSEGRFTLDVLRDGNQAVEFGSLDGSNAYQNTVQTQDVQASKQSGNTENIVLKITPEKTSINTANEAQKVKYTISVSLNDKAESIGSIQFKLLPPSGMNLGSFTYPEEEKMQSIFNLCQYDAASRIFIAANTSEGLSSDLVLLEIEATVEKGVQGELVLDVVNSGANGLEFGNISGDKTLTAQVQTVPLDADNQLQSAAIIAAIKMWNNVDDVYSWLYDANISDEEIRKDLAEEIPQKALVYQVSKGEMVPLADKKSYSQTLKFTDIPKGAYKLAIAKDGKYMPQIMEIAIEGDSYDVNQELFAGGEIKLWLYGDVTNDGRVNSSDALQIQRYYAGKTSQFDNGSEFDISDRKNAADITFDGKINSSDALQIQRFYAGKTSAFDKLK